MNISSLSPPRAATHTEIAPRPVQPTTPSETTQPAVNLTPKAVPQTGVPDQLRQEAEQPQDQADALAQQQVGEETRKLRKAQEKTDSEPVFEVAQDQESGKTVLKMKTGATGDLLWQFPTEQLLDLARESGAEKGGLLVDREA